MLYIARRKLRALSLSMPKLRRLTEVTATTASSFKHEKLSDPPVSSPC